MLRKEISEMVSRSKGRGWVLEPEAKRLLGLAGLDVPRFAWAREPEEALRFAQTVGYPVVAKVVSPKALHKSDVGGVAVGIDDERALDQVFHRLRAFDASEGVLIEEMLAGLELIIGAKKDFQFGPVVLLGVGGTGVEIYHDAVLRMAPLTEDDAVAMIKGLKAHRLLEGYRGSKPINRSELIRALMSFSDLVMQLEPTIASIDLNPVICGEKKCVVADARIILAPSSQG